MDPAELTERKDPKSEDKQPPAPPASEEPKKVLVVDDEVDISALALKLQADIAKDFEAVKARKLGSFEEAKELVVAAVVGAEEIGKDFALAGHQKKALVVEVVNHLVDIPGIPEFLEGKLIGFAVDLVIVAVNKLIGDAWLEKVL